MASPPLYTNLITSTTHKVPVDLAFKPLFSLTAVICPRSSRNAASKPTEDWADDHEVGLDIDSIKLSTPSLNLHRRKIKYAVKGGGGRRRCETSIEEVYAFAGGGDRGSMHKSFVHHNNSPFSTQTFSKQSDPLSPLLSRANTSSSSVSTVSSISTAGVTTVISSASCFSYGDASSSSVQPFQPLEYNYSWGAADAKGEATTSERVKRRKLSDQGLFE
ncbi:hypothetical protein TrRE_jg6096 [Triparma retinervis]|uniref:Uncharacterized protein n=1 Tax=Triparma retinervis TaxID=2557542 RepID=A0A9W6ZQ82_9STRA|nr:hypothetical protein TrRE_jg6096 [Triparma retinervis]